MSLLFEASEGRRKLEWPKEIVCCFKVGTNCHNLVNQVFNARNSAATKFLINHGVVIEWNSATINLAEATAVNKFWNCAASGISIGDKGLDIAYHVPGGAVESYKDTIVKLTQSKKLQNLLLFWGKLVNTSNSDNKCNFGFWLNEEVACFLCASLCFNKCFVGSSVLASVLLSILKGDSSLFSAFFLSLLTIGFAGSEKFSIACGLFLDVLWYNSCPKTHQKMS